MARPQDMERAATFIEAQKADRDRYATEPSESILTTKARRLQILRRQARDAALGTGSLKPVQTYREALDEYMCYLHLGEHIAQCDRAKQMLAIIDAAVDREALAVILTEQESTINSIHKGALR